MSSAKVVFFSMPVILPIKLSASQLYALMNMSAISFPKVVIVFTIVVMIAITAKILFINSPLTTIKMALKTPIIPLIGPAIPLNIPNTPVNPSFIWLTLSPIA